jgi:hypothetical protein
VPLPHSVTKRFAGAYLTAAKQVHVHPETEVKSEAEVKAVKGGRTSLSGDGAGPSDREDIPNPLRMTRRNPEEYKSAKKDLKKAMLEHYRCVAVL